MSTHALVGTTPGAAAIADGAARDRAAAAGAGPADRGRAGVEARGQVEDGAMAAATAKAGGGASAFDMLLSSGARDESGSGPGRIPAGKKFVVGKKGSTTAGGGGGGGGGTVTSLPLWKRGLVDVAQSPEGASALRTHPNVISSCTVLQDS